MRERTSESLHAEGEGPTMLLYNGMLSSHTHWKYWRSHFRKSHTVATWDYPGHGGSTRPKALDEIGIVAFARRGSRALDAAPVPKPAIVCGLSMGVQVALEHYRLAPDSVRALVLVCGTHDYPLPTLARSRPLRTTLARTLYALGRRPALVRGLLSPVVRTPLGRFFSYHGGGATRGDCPVEILDEILAHTSSLDPDIMTRIVGDYLTHTAEDILPAITVPTLIIAGERDGLAPLAVCHGMRNQIPNSELRVIPRRSHLAIVECPDALHEMVEDFLRRRVYR